ncbi:MAG: hypothetical protein ACR2H3_10900 [Acidimicrobiales bacterium]
MPSVRGLTRAKVVLVLAGSAASTAALVGFATGLIWAAAELPRLSPTAAATALVIAAALDPVVRPLAVQRQVPQAWGRLFGAPTAALLYGSRLGPGPLTILSTWLWWTALIVGSSTGAWGGAAVGATFGLGRVVVMLAVGTRAGRLRRHERRAGVTVALVSITLAVALAIAAGQTNSAVAGPSSAAARAVGAPSAKSRSTTTVVGNPVGPIRPDEDVAGRLPDDAGGGYIRVTDRAERGLGPLDLRAAAAAEDDEEAERSLLETRGFERGHARAWQSPGRVAYAAVYRFATANGAEAYARDGLINVEGRGVRHYPVETPAGGTGFGSTSESADGSAVSQGLAFVRGRYFYLVIVTGDEGDTVSPYEARALAVTVDSVLWHADRPEP